MAHRVQRGTHNMLIPWVAPLKEKSDAPREILRTIKIIPSLGPLRGPLGGEFINEPLIEGCQDTKIEG
eukprot:1849422-Prorocentrum_lima.AAC.1